MTLPRWVGRFGKKVRRHKKKWRTDNLKHFLFEDFGLDEIIRCDVTVCDLMERKPKVYSVQMVSKKATNATTVVRRSSDIRFLAHEMARKLHSDCPHCGIQNVSELTSPRSIGPFINDYKFDEELTHEFWNRYRFERDIIYEREIRRKIYEEGRFRIGVDMAKGRDYTAYSELLKLCPSTQELLHD